MNRRTTRSDAHIDRPELLSALGVCRTAVIREMSKMKAGGPLYYSGSTVVAAIDALALMLTGERDYFSLTPHSTGGSKAD